MANKRNQSVSDFPPEFLQIWQLALEGKLSLSFPFRGTATNLKQRLYTFRKRLLEESPILGTQFVSIDLKVIPEKNAAGAETFALVQYIPEWKKQVAKQAAGVNMLPNMQGRIGISEQEIEERNKVADFDLLPAPAPLVAPSALDQTLASQGYTSQEEEKDK